LLSKDIINAQNVSQKVIECNQTSNNNLTQIDGQKIGCYICDHNIKTMEESSLDFLVSQKCISDPKTKLNDEHKNEWLLQKNPSLSCDNNQKNGLKGDKENSVPSKTFVNTSDAINNRDISAKHNDNYSNNEQKRDDLGKREQLFQMNGINKQKTGYSEDIDKDISDTFEW